MRKPHLRFQRMVGLWSVVLILLTVGTTAESKAAEENQPPNKPPLTLELSVIVGLKHVQLLCTATNVSENPVTTSAELFSDNNAINFKFPDGREGPLVINAGNDEMVILQPGDVKTWRFNLYDCLIDNLPGQYSVYWTMNGVTSNTIPVLVVERERIK